MNGKEFKKAQNDYIDGLCNHFSNAAAYGILSACPLCGTKDVYIPKSNSSINCSKCPCMAQSDVLTIEELIAEWNKYSR